jgi:polyisoprenoid-binding protein YceI
MTKVAGQPPPGTYSLDPPHTFVVFAARHVVVGMVRGRFDRVSGTVVVTENPAESRVEVTIDAASISTQNSVRDEDLRGPDFFDVKNNPAATYQGVGIRPDGAGWIMDGTAMIRGVGKVVPLSITFNGTAPAQTGRPIRLAFHATAATRRADFGMTRELLSEIGPGAKGPDVWLEIDAEVLAEGHS